jgi:hypothetical protein
MHGSEVRLRYLVVVALTGALLLSILLLMPVSLRSIYSDLGTIGHSEVLDVSLGSGSTPAIPRTSIHISIAGLDEVQQRLTLRVSGNHVCPPGCNWTDRLIFFSIRTNEAETAGMPPSATIDLAPGHLVVTNTLELPIRGQPGLYPFDEYDIWLGIGLARVFPDGSVRPYSAAEAAEDISITFQEQLPRQIMEPPVQIAPAALAQPDDPYPYLAVESLRFERPQHVRVLGVLLVLLVAAAAAYAVFWRPLQDLVLNAGALVLGVWGIRAIITPSNFSHLTAIDLALSVIILFLLGAITFRALQFAHGRSGVPLFRRSKSDATAAEQCDQPDCKNPIAARCAHCKGAFCPRHVSTGYEPTCDACAEQRVPV